MARKLVKSKFHTLSHTKGGQWYVNKTALRNWAKTQEDGNYGILIYPIQGATLSQIHDLIFEVQANNKRKGQGNLFGKS